MDEIKLVPGTDPALLYRSFTPLEVIHEGRDHRQAFSATQASFQLLRSALNLEALGRYTIQIGRPNPLGRVRVPPVSGIFRESGDLAGYYYEENPPHSYSRPRLAERTLMRAERLLRELRHARSGRTTLGLIEDAIEKYGKALDTTNWSEAFLCLWQVLELLTHDPDGKYSMDEVCKRAKILLRQHPLLADLLDVCYVTRNRLVHAGRFAEEGLRDVQMLKKIVEVCIATTYGLRRACPTRESLFTYYRLASVSNNELEVQSRVISHIKRIRQRAT
ncbi:MAG: hypothetical protein HPY69_02345 [Armatimonadetes bacterium]|nr:hypothetical protein [Armatimonadota bacterium]